MPWQQFWCLKLRCLFFDFPPGGSFTAGGRLGSFTSAMGRMSSFSGKGNETDVHAKDQHSTGLPFGLPKSKKKLKQQVKQQQLLEAEKDRAYEQEKKLWEQEQEKSRLERLAVMLRQQQQEEEKAREAKTEEKQEPEEQEQWLLPAEQLQQQQQEEERGQEQQQELQHEQDPHLHLQQIYKVRQDGLALACFALLDEPK